MNARTSLLASLLLLILRPAFGIEIETVEKREERGNIGYVDMQKVFKEFPGTVRAKENFEDLVRQAEEQVNLRKAEVLRLRNELSDLKISRDAVSKILVVLSTPPAVAPNPFELDKPAPAPTTPLVLSTVSDKPFSLPGLEKPFDTTAKPEPLVINIPGVSTAPIVVQPPSPAETPKPAVVPAAVAKSSGPAVVAVAVSSAPAVNPAWAELDAKVAQGR